ncbi:hypothetical protein QCA50_011018 [Cerrena zonata]|uniref:Uncharacterized protein n=1 Tax=Cerrena zonata TaxID=2478898 RepID=A0AAW0G5U8_9APHY
MPSYDTLGDEDVFGSSNSMYLTPSPRKSPSSKPAINGRRSSTSLRGASLAQSLDDDAGHGKHSLAHELAVALMPEPSAGSRLLAEEFGIEYDEGAEGIDDESRPDVPNDGPYPNGTPDTFSESSDHPRTPPSFDVPPDIDPAFGSSPVTTPHRPTRLPDQDPMTVLAQDLEFTERFLTQLRRLDTESHGASSTLEKLASDMIRRIDDTAREREGQVRELLGYEREFRKISGEIGGNDVLGQLDELEDILESDSPPRQTSQPQEDTHSPQDTRRERLDMIQEEPSQLVNSTSDWEAYLDRDRERLGGDGAEDDDDVTSPLKATFSAPPPIIGPPTPATTRAQLTHFRTFTASAASSLAVISEQTQVNSAATTEAGRKIRALKNKLGGWRTEWENAERSRVRIEKWEAGIPDSEDLPSSSSSGVSSVPGTPSRGNFVNAVPSRRIDGRKLVQEHLQAFERALSDANIKTQAIMAGVP